jgi:hypothetical protein
METTSRSVVPFWRPVAVALIVHTALLALYVRKYRGDMTALVACGENRVHLSAYQQITRTIGPGGHDGQFYFALAQTPWDRHGEDLDLPIYRHVRILYPAVCWLCSGGDPQALIWVMPLINLLVIAAVAFLGCRFAYYYGVNPWWGCALPAALNLGLAAQHDFTDPMATLGVIWLIWTWTQRPSWGVTLLATIVAVFAREQNLVVLAVVMRFAFQQQRWKDFTAVTLGLLIYAAWLGYLGCLYGKMPFVEGTGNFEAPLSGIIFRCRHLGGMERFSARFGIIISLAMIHLLFQLGLVCYFSLQRRSDPLVMGMTLAGAALALTAGNYVYVDFWSFTRIFAWMPLGLWLLSLQANYRVVLYSLVVPILWPIFAGLGYV